VKKSIQCNCTEKTSKHVCSKDLIHKRNITSLALLAFEEKVFYHKLYFYFSHYITFLANHEKIMQDIFSDLKYLRMLKCQSINVCDENSFVFKNFIQNAVYKITVICSKNEVNDFLAKNITLQELLENYGTKNISMQKNLPCENFIPCKICAQISARVKIMSHGSMHICDRCGNAWLEK
jgi:hypothetical protein